MGGSKKQAQRTKGNARPSNSSRSAERLLASPAGASHLSGFAGFGNIQLQTDHLTLLKAAGEVDPLIDGDCRMLMKRMTKKDAITRLKALQEFQHLCTSCGEDALLGALPIWPRLFNKLCLDVDRKVREATHRANNQLVLRMKRNMAPHIKGMMANWLLGLCDPYAPAATAAKAAFNSAFSQEKRLEAIMFCRENIFTTVTDYLFQQTPQTLADSEAVPVEVMEESYNRVLSSSLLALGCVLDLASSNEHQKLAENYEKIVGEGKFWKFPKSQVPQVRNAWFCAIVAMCGKIPTVLKTHLPKLCPAVLGKLDEGEPLVVPAVWDAALHVLIAFETCWTHVNLQKAVLPKLMAILRKGCDGNAKATGPYLLPLLSKIPADACPTSGKFNADFFSNLRQGIALEKVQSSASECGALVSAYVECLRFLVIDASSDSRKNASVAEDLILTNLLPMIESSLLEESSRLAQTPLYPLLGDFLSRLRHLGSSSAYYQGLERYFWNAFGRLSLTCVDRSSSLPNLRSMLAALARKEPALQASKRKTESRKVRFSDDPNEPGPRPKSTDAEDDSRNPDKDPHLAACASGLCAVAAKRYGSERSPAHLGFLVETHGMFACVDLCQALLQAAGLAAEDPAEDAATRLYGLVVLKWLEEAGRGEVPQLIKLAFDVLGLVEDRTAALDRLCGAETAGVLSSAVREALSREAARPWLQGASFGEAVLRRAGRLLDEDPGDDAETWDLLGLCLVPPVVAPDCAGRLLDVVSGIFDVFGTDERTKQACALTTRFFLEARRCWTLPESEALLSAVLRLGRRLSTAGQSEDEARVEACWRAGVASLLLEDRDEPPRCLLEECRALHDGPVRGEDPMSGLAATAGFARRILEATRDEEGRDRPATTRLASAVLPTEEEWTEVYEASCREALVLHAVGGELIFVEAEEPRSEATPDGGRRALACGLLAAEVLESLEEPRRRDRTEDFGRFLLTNSLGILNAASFCALVSKEHGEDVAGRGWGLWAEDLRERLATLMDAGRGQKLLLEGCFGQARKRGFLCAYSLRHLVTVTRAEVDVDELMAQMDSGPCVQVLQVLVPALDGGRRMEVLERLMREPAYGDAGWLAVVGACVRRGCPSGWVKSPEKTGKSRRTEVSGKSTASPRPEASEGTKSDGADQREGTDDGTRWEGRAVAEESTWETMERSAEDSGRSTVTAERPIETSERSAEGSERSIQDSERSVQDSERSIQDYERSAESSETSDEGSGKSTETSQSSTEASERSIQDSERSNESSERSVEDSESSVKDAETSNEGSGKSTEASQSSTEACERSVEASERSIQDSERSIQDSERSIQDSERSVEGSQTSTTASELTAETTERPAETLEMPVEDPERPFDASERSVEASERPIEAPESSRDFPKSAGQEDSAAGVAKEILQGLIRHKEESPDSFLFARELPDSWPPVTLNVQLVGLLTALAADHWPALEAEHRDFVLCSLGSWLQSCHRSRFPAAEGRLRFDAFSAAVCRLTATVATAVNRTAEWTEFFAPRFYVLLLDLFADRAAEPDLASAAALEALAAAMEWIPAEAVVSNGLPPCLDARWGENDAYLPAAVSTALNRFSPLLTSPLPDVQRGAFAVLRSLVAVLPGFAAAGDLGQDEEAPDLVPGALAATLSEAGRAVDRALAEADFGEASEAVDEALARGYLCAAGLVLRLLAGLSTEARSGQAAHLRDSGVVAVLLKNLFRMMPANPVAPKMGSVFSPPVADSCEAASLDLHQLSFAVYLELLRRLPALAREWWAGLDRRSSVLVSRFTARHASPLLIGEDIGAVHGAQKKLGNTSVRTRPSAREVVANYDVDEIKFELVVRLADDHPLGPVAIETGRRVGVTTQQWRVWLLQLTTFLMHQNGSILDGLVLWQRNIDKKFEGVEECYVCYYVLHSSTCQLPRKVCKVCKKKFHASCLYKWFTTSGHSTCPLCRSQW